MTLETLKRIRMVYGFQITNRSSKNDKTEKLSSGKQNHLEMVKGNIQHSITLTENQLKFTVISDTVKKTIKNKTYDNITKDSWYNFLYCFNWLDSNSKEFVPTFRNFSISDQKW